MVMVVSMVLVVLIHAVLVTKMKAIAMMVMGESTLGEAKEAEGTVTKQMRSMGHSKTAGCGPRRHDLLRRPYWKELTVMVPPQDRRR